MTTESQDRWLFTKLFERLFPVSSRTSFKQHVKARKKISSVLSVSSDIRYRGCLMVIKHGANMHGFNQVAPGISSQLILRCRRNGGSVCHVTLMSPTLLTLESDASDEEIDKSEAAVVVYADATQTPAQRITPTLRRDTGCRARTDASDQSLQFIRSPFLRFPHNKLNKKWHDQENIKFSAVFCVQILQIWGIS